MFVFLVLRALITLMKLMEMSRDWLEQISVCLCVIYVHCSSSIFSKTRSNANTPVFLFTVGDFQNTEWILRRRRRRRHFGWSVWQDRGRLRKNDIEHDFLTDCPRCCYWSAVKLPENACVLDAALFVGGKGGKGGRKEGASRWVDLAFGLVCRSELSSRRRPQGANKRVRSHSLSLSAWEKKEQIILSLAVFSFYLIPKASSVCSRVMTCHSDTHRITQLSSLWRRAFTSFHHQPDTETNSYNSN